MLPTTLLTVCPTCRTVHSVATPCRHVALPEATDAHVLSGLLLAIFGGALLWGLLIALVLGCLRILGGP